MLPTDYRAHYNLPDDLHFLDGAAQGPQLRAVTEAGIDAVRRKEVPTSIRAEHYFEPVARLRASFAELLGVSAHCIATVPSVSYAMASVARVIDVPAGKRIVSVADVFPSSYYTWSAYAKTRGCTFELIGPPAGSEDFAADWNARLLDAIDDTCGLAVVPPVHWITGVAFDLSDVRRHCDAVGARLVVDATQWLGARPFDFESVRPDALTCAGYKWLGHPYALGYLYLADDLHDGVPLEQNWSTRRGAKDFARLTHWTEEYQPGAVRFTMGEAANFINVAMGQVALDQLLAWGPAAVAAHTSYLVGGYWARFEALGYALPSSRFRVGHLFSLALPEGADPVQLRADLQEARVAVSLRGEYIRVSPHVSSREEDLDALVGVLNR